MLENIMVGLSVAFQPFNILIVAAGVALGICFGALPGLSASMGVAVLIPLTYSMDPVPGLIMLAGVYCGATYGGSISAVLINTPGTPANAATALDGHAMTKLGKGKEALTESIVASFWGGIISALALLLIAPALARFSLRFGPQENALLGVFGLTIIASLCSKSLLKGAIGGVLGLLIACVGMDPVTGWPRYTFNSMGLLTGVPQVPALIGLYSISQVLSMVIAKQRYIVNDDVLNEMKTKKASLRDLIRYPRIYLESGIIGVIVGIIPGAGGNIASFLSYNEAKRLSKTPEEFGHGSREGVAASEAGNNGVTGGALIPMLTLGIPGNAVTAILLGGLMIQGLYPGNDLFTNRANITYPFIIGFFLANLFMLLEGLFASTWFAKIVKVPSNFLAAGILVLTIVGAFAINNSMSDVYVMLVFGVIGFVLKQIDFDPTPIVLGMILGSITERGLMQSITLNHGMLPALQSMLTRPICLVLIAMSLVSLAVPLYQARKTAKKAVDPGRPRP